MTKPSSPSISVVVPVYNSEEMLKALVRRLTDTLTGLRAPFEIILVNDGSRDASWSVIAELSSVHAHVRGIDLMRNYGQHNALLAGIRASRNNLIVTLDDDLQNPPEEIPKLLQKMEQGYDVVYGKPEQEQHGFWRNLASRVAKMVLKEAMGAETARHVSAFRVFRTYLRDAFAEHQGPFVSIDVLLTWATGRFALTPVRHEPRRSGLSHYTFKKLITHTLNMLTGFGTWPLRLASLVGFGLTLFAAMVLVYVVGRYLIEGGSVPGFPFLASLIALSAGAQLFSLGIIGEYLARMHMRSLDRPPYVVRESIGGSFSQTKVEER
jgi:undecaprenyl-phosphate 4-deoxy-4-formamido-L-arabinose transferase